MKVTVCFGSTRVVVPCKDGDIYVQDLIDKAIERYKKATGKPSGSWVTVHNLKSLSDGGILDRDDKLNDVADDREQIIAIYEEQNAPYLVHNGGDGTSTSSVGTDSPDIFQTTDEAKSGNSNGQQQQLCHTDVENLGDGVPSGISMLQVRRGSEPALNRLSPVPNVYLDPMKRWSTAVVLDDKNQNTSRSPAKDKRDDPVDGEVLSERGDGSGEEKSSAFQRFARDSGRLSVLGSNGASYLWVDAADRQALKLLGNGRRDPVGGPNVRESCRERDMYDRSHLVVLHNDGGPLGIHVIPEYDETGRDFGLVVQGIEPGGKVHQDGRISLGDRIIEINRNGLVNITFNRAQEIFKDALQCSEIRMRLLKYSGDGSARPPPPVFPRPGLFINGSDAETENHNFENNNAASSWITSTNHTAKTTTPLLHRNANTMLTSNTRRIGKKYPILLTKGPNGLGFSITTRDNLAGGNCPIYIKNILPKGAAVEDGRLKPGDRLLEVNGTEMTGKSQNEAAAILRNAPAGSVVNLIVSRQEVESPNLPRQLMGSDYYSSGGELAHPSVTPAAVASSFNDPPPEKITDDGMIFPWKHRELLTLEIPLNDTGSAGLGVSVKGKTSTGPSGTVDLGIFVKSVIHGGAASKDGRLCENDQLVSVNSVSLLGRANSYAMETLRRVMHQEGPNPGAITLTIARRVSPGGHSSTSTIERSAHPPSSAQSSSSHLIQSSSSSNFSLAARTNHESPSPGAATTASLTTNGSGRGAGLRVLTPTSDAISVASCSTSTTTDSERTTVFRPYGRSSGGPTSAVELERQRQQRHFVNAAGYANIEDKDLGTDCYPSPLRNPIVDRITGQKSGGGGLQQQPRNESYYQACHDSWSASPTQQHGGSGGVKPYVAEHHQVPLSPPQMHLHHHQRQQRNQTAGGTLSTTMSSGHDDSVMIEDEYGGVTPQVPRILDPANPLSAVPPGLGPTNVLNPAYVSQASLDEDAANFDRDGFGRQSMSEKRNAQLDARNTDTWQRNKKAREEKGKKKGSGEIETTTDGTHLGGGGHSEVGSTNLVRSNSADSLISVSRMQRTANGCSGMKKSNSLESIPNDSDGVYGRQSGGNAPGRNRGCNESFRAAVDRSYDAPPLEPGETMDTLDEESESGSSSNVGRGSLRQGTPVNLIPGGDFVGEDGVRFGSKKEKKKGFIKSLFRIGKNKKEPNSKSRQSAILGIESNEHYMKIDPDAIYAQKVSDEEQERFQLEQQKRLAAQSGSSDWKQKSGDSANAQPPSQPVTTSSSNALTGVTQHHTHNHHHHLAPTSRLAAYQNGVGGGVRPPPPPIPIHGGGETVNPSPQPLSTAEHQIGASSTSSSSSRQEKISQLRAQHQKKHVERQGQYPQDDREERLQNRSQDQVDRKNENPNISKKHYETEVVHSRSHSYDLYQERPRAPPANTSEPNNKYSHYMNYAEIQQHILRQQRPRPSAPVPGNRKERPVSNYYEYESIQPTYGTSVATALVVSVSGDGGASSRTHHHHQQQPSQQHHHHHNHHHQVAPTNNYPAPVAAFAGSNHSSLRSTHARPAFANQPPVESGVSSNRGNNPVNGDAGSHRTAFKTVVGSGKTMAPGRPSGNGGGMTSSSAANQSRPLYHVAANLSNQSSAPGSNKYLLLQQQQQQQQQHRSSASLKNVSRHVVESRSTKQNRSGTRDPTLAGSKV